MSDVVFRQSSTESAEPVEQPTKSNEPTTQRDVEVEVPFTLYRQDKGKSLIAEYFGIEDGWDDKNVYGKEVEEIEQYFEDKIGQGGIENTPKAVKEVLKRYEKAIGYTPEERTVVKVQKLIAYLDFRRVVDGIEKNNQIYGNK